MRKVISIKDIPTTPHFAALEEVQVYTSDNYGGGEEENNWNYIIFDSEEEMSQWVEAKLSGHGSSSKKFVLLSNNPIKYERNVTIKPS